MNHKVPPFNRLSRHPPSSQSHSHRDQPRPSRPVQPPPVANGEAQVSKWFNPRMMRNPVLTTPNFLRLDFDTRRKEPTHIPSSTPRYTHAPMPEYTLKKWDGGNPVWKRQETLTPWRVEEAKDWSWIGPREFISEAIDGLPVRIPDAVKKPTTDFPTVDIRPYLSPNEFGTFTNLKCPVERTNYAMEVYYAELNESPYHSSSDNEQSQQDGSAPQLESPPSLDSSATLEPDLAAAKRLHEQSKRARRFSDDDIFCPRHLREGPFITQDDEEMSNKIAGEMRKQMLAELALLRVQGVEEHDLLKELDNL